MLVGYARVSTPEQDPGYQLRALERRGCELVSLTEKIDTSTPGDRVVFTVMAALAQFESDLNSERTKEACRAIRATGRHWGRPSPFHDPETVKTAKALVAAGTLTKPEIAKRLGVSKTTL